tara:strand:- start:12316 stop:13434 length:1119 start_codon:yes stop_codon:yes gene_type:complete
MSKNEEVEFIWHEQQEKILKRWSEIGSSYRFMHDRAYLYFEKQNFRFALPVIILSTITGTANFAQGSFPAAWAAFVPLFIGFLNLSAGLITTVAQFLRVSELLEGHRAASISYSKFSRNISVELSLPPDERSSGGREFIAARRTELDRLIEQSPNIPMHIVKEFGKIFQDSSFIKPDILEISGVEIFNDSENKKAIAERKMFELKQLEDKRKMEMKQFELNLMKEKRDYENDLINKIRNDEAKLRKEFEEKMKIKLQQEKKNIKNQQKIKAIEKKKNMSIHNIRDNMSHLIKKLEQADKHATVLTPIASEESSEETISEELTSDEPVSDESNTNTPVAQTFEDIVIEEENEVIPVTDANIDVVIDISENSLN